MRSYRRLLSGAGVSVVAIVTMGYGAISAQLATGSTEEIAPLATPEGINIQPLGLAQGYSMNKASATKLPRKEIVFADSEGMTLYYNDMDPPGRSVCVEECAKIWPPALVQSDAEPVANWSVITREDGLRQWAYKSKSLYTYTKDVDIGSVGGNSPKRFGRGPKIGPRGRTSDSIPKDVPMPKGWHAAMVYPVTDAKLPGGFVIRQVEDAMAQVLVGEESGKTLYAFDGDANAAMRACSSTECQKHWSPVVAPRIAIPMGDFTAGVRHDGITQWEYKGRALFTYSGDLAVGDANGIGVDEDWQIAAHVRYFVPSNVTTERSRKLGKVLATADGKTLYRRNSHIFQSGSGHSLRRGDPIRPAVGRDLGTNPRCVSECNKWHPFLAPADAQTWGDWRVATRADGSKQWVQRGYALWTYDGDKKPGDINGNDSYRIVVGHDDKTVIDIGTPIDGPWALLWIAAAP